jgi:hypothetical protein
MKQAQPISLEDISLAVGPLTDEQRALVIDFAHALAHRDELRLPDGIPFDGAELKEWQARQARYAVRVLEQRRRELEALGLPSDGDLPASEWPSDMLETSKTSVAT